MAIPQQAAPQVPTKGTLEDQITGLVVERSQLKDRVEAIEKQMPVISSMLQLLAAQEAAAKAAGEVTED